MREDINTSIQNLFKSGKPALAEDFLNEMNITLRQIGQLSPRKASGFMS
jgi:hypothetical protein